MKKTIRVISFLIVFSMILVSFSACGKKVPISERLDEAIQKMFDSKVMDMEITGRMIISTDGMKIDAPITASMKGDMRDENNLKSSIAVNFSLMGQDFSVKSCAVDGMNYSDLMGTKLKSPVSGDNEENFENMMGMSSAEFRKIFVETYKIDNAEIKEEKNGSFKAKFTLGEESDLSKSFSAIFEAFSGKSASELGDTTVEFEIDKDNTLVSALINMSMKINIENLEMAYNMTLDIIYNPIDDDFKIEAPADADSYAYSFES